MRFEKPDQRVARRVGRVPVPGPAAVTAAPSVFPVLLTQTGGANGSELLPASWIYTVTAIDAAQGDPPLAVDVDPAAGGHRYVRPSLGRVTPATFGYAHYETVDGVSVLRLGWVNEVPFVVACN